MLNKIDLQAHLDFNMDAFQKSVIDLNPDVILFPVSCKSGEGMEAWFSWLESEVKVKKSK
jgi:hydrogenase nickel incorporation protein HypB